MKKCGYCNGTGIKVENKKSNPKDSRKKPWDISAEEKSKPCPKCYGKGVK